MASGGKGILVVLAGAAFAGLVGPKVMGAHDRAAGKPFEYVPPPHFKDAEGPGSEDAKAMFRKAWTYHGPKVATLDRIPTLNLTHSPRSGTVEPDDMRRIADGMPEMYRTSDVTWTFVRVATRTRPDGARVGLLEGELSVKEQAGVRKWRSMQVAFPDDEGTSIVTASYGLTGAKEWADEVEATIDQAQGVALRAPPPPTWLSAAWAGGGAVLAAVLVLLFGRRGAEAPAPATKEAGRPKPEERRSRAEAAGDGNEDEDEDEDADEDADAAEAGDADADDEDEDEEDEGEGDDGGRTPKAAPPDKKP